MAVHERGSIVGEPGPVPMSSATAHHEAGHATACEHFGLGWVIHGPIDDDNCMSRTELRDNTGFRSRKRGFHRDGGLGSGKPLRRQLE